MKNNKFILQKDYESLARLKIILLNRLYSELGIKLSEELMHVVLSSFNVNRQINIHTIALEETNIDITKHLHLGYMADDKSTTRFYCTPLIGDVDLGYVSNRTIISKTIMKTDLVIAKFTEVTSSFRNRKYYIHSKDFLVIIKRGGSSNEDKL